MRFLCLSDIHGNLRALEAVLKDADGRGWDQLLVCGDLCFPGEAPLEVYKKLVELRAVPAQGLGDRALSRFDPAELAASSPSEQERLDELSRVRSALGEIILKKLARLPPVIRLPLESGQELTLVHGSPTDPSEALSIEMSDEEMSELLGDDPGDLVVCGGSHVAFERLIGEVRVINVGSVGEAPGGLHADAAIIETGPEGAMITPFAVPLDGAG